MPIPAGAVCARCGDPLPADNTPKPDPDLCRACHSVPPPFERAVAYGLYEDRMRAAVHALKYDRMHPAARRLGAMLAQAIVKLAGQAPPEMLVIPVPLHRLKHRQRGFNQARALAEHAIRALKRSHPAWRLTMAPKTLMRLRATGTQAGLSPHDRRLNVRGAFQVTDAGAVRGRDVLLIDDIMTTGATARAASLALMRAETKSVWVATLARAGRVLPSRPAVAAANETYESTGEHDTPRPSGQVAGPEDEAMHSFEDSF